MKFLTNYYLVSEGWKVNITKLKYHLTYITAIDNKSYCYFVSYKQLLIFVIKRILNYGTD